jgi:hypothetical protein
MNSTLAKRNHNDTRLDGQRLDLWIDAFGNRSTSAAPVGAAIPAGGPALLATVM